MYSLTVLEARIPKSGCQQRFFLGLGLSEQSLEVGVTYIEEEVVVQDVVVLAVVEAEAPVLRTKRRRKEF